MHPIIRAGRTRRVAAATGGAGGGGGGGGFTPVSIPGCLLYLQDTGPFWQDAARTIPAVLDGDPIGAWDDLSGLGNHVTQATSTKRPTLKLGIKNGRAVVRMDGADDFLVVVSNAGLNPTEITIAVALVVNSFANTPLYVAKTAAYSLYSGPTGTVVADLPNNLSSAAGAVVTGTWYLLELVVTAAVSMFQYRNAVQLATRATALALGSNLNSLGIGANGAGAEPTAGDFAGVAIYNRPLLTAERQQLEGFINGRLAIY